MKIINVTCCKSKLARLTCFVSSVLFLLFYTILNESLLQYKSVTADSSQMIEDYRDMGELSWARKMMGRNFIQICQNKQTFHNEIAVWTLLADDVENYGMGAIKLLKSIKRNVIKTKFDAFVLELVTKPIRPTQMREKLLQAGWRICQVNRIAPREENKTRDLFRDTFTALILWNVTEYKAHYHFDSDTLALRNLDELFTTHTKFNPDEHKIGCTKDWRENQWQNTFNMGVFVVKPNQSEFNRLIELKDDSNFHYEMIMSQQGFLNVVYKDLWYEIGFENSANLVVYTTDREFWNKRVNSINIIHFTVKKPWSCSWSTWTYKVPCDLWRRF